MSDIKKLTRHATPNEKVAWARKKKKLEQLIQQVEPIEQQILELIKQKQPLLDQIAALRQQMVKECVHPIDSVVELDNGLIKCKFCEKQFKINNGST